MRLTIISIFCILTQIVLGQKTNGVNFDYVEIIDQEWDSIANNGALKMKKIHIPSSQMSEVEIKFDEKVKTIIEVEVNQQLKALKSTYADEGISKNVIVKLTNQTCYRFGTATLAVFEHTVDFEYTKIVTLLIIDNDEHLLYSKFNKLGLEIEIKSVWKAKEEYLIYGTSRGNPEFNCGGNFELIFRGNERIVKYSYCEENN
uniref:hypothetical protein n=1 Tax=Flavobacterium sp. TaxID=239 RepID=UPI0040493B25